MQLRVDGLRLAEKLCFGQTEITAWKAAWPNFLLLFGRNPYLDRFSRMAISCGPSRMDRKRNKTSHIGFQEVVSCVSGIVLAYPTEFGPSHSMCFREGHSHAPWFEVPGQEAWGSGSWLWA